MDFEPIATNAPMAIMVLRNRPKIDFWQKLGCVLGDAEAVGTIWIFKTEAEAAWLIVYIENDQLSELLKRHAVLAGDTKFSSFTRQLNRKGFKKCTGTGTENVFYHETFALNWMFHVDNIKNHKSISKKPNSNLEEEIKDLENRVRTLDSQVKQKIDESKEKDCQIQYYKQVIEDKDVKIEMLQKEMSRLSQALKDRPWSSDPQKVLELVANSSNQFNQSKNRDQELFAPAQPVNSAQDHGIQSSNNELEIREHPNGPNLNPGYHPNGIHGFNPPNQTNPILGNNNIQAEPPIHAGFSKHPNNPKQQNKGEKIDEETQSADPYHDTLAGQPQFRSCHGDEPKSGHKIQTRVNQKSNRQSSPTKNPFINDDPSIMPIGNKSAFLGKDDLLTDIAEENKINQSNLPFLTSDTQINWGSKDDTSTFEHFKNNDPPKNIQELTNIVISELIQPEQKRGQKANHLPNRRYKQRQSQNPLGPSLRNALRATGQRSPKRKLPNPSAHDERFMVPNPSQNHTNQRDSPKPGVNEFIEYRGGDLYDPFKR